MFLRQSKQTVANRQTQPHLFLLKHDCMFRSTQTIITQPLQNFHCIPPYFESIVTVAWWWCEQIETFYISSSVHRNSRLKKPNKMQQYADIYILLNYSTCFGCPSHPSSGVHKTLVATSGTDHDIWEAEASFFKRDQLVTFEEACFPDSMICTRGCNYSFMYSWWWVWWTPETCRVI